VGAYQIFWTAHAIFLEVVPTTGSLLP